LFVTGKSIGKGADLGGLAGADAHCASLAKAAGSAQIGHHDRHGGGNTSCNSAQGSRGCSRKNLQGTGGAGFLYCFAAD